MKIGTISDHINRKTITIFVLQFLFIMTVLGYRSWLDSSVECVRCHADREKMQSLGYPDLYVTQEMVEKESRHPNVQCHHCHLGNGRAKDADAAHKDMLKALFVGDHGTVLPRRDVTREALIPRGTDRIREMLPQVRDNGGLQPHPSVRNVLWHDRDPVTFNYDPSIAAKTCGRAGCHPEEVKQFNTTVMGTNYRQRTMTTWLKPYGPQN